MNGSHSKSVPFKQVDVFTAVPFQGNPVAVVLDGNNLTTARIQSVANWTNLSETTFVCSPTLAEADYRLRIFTPRSELPFAGHPTLGSAWAVLQHGLKPKIPGRLVQECGQGLIALRMVGPSLFLALPEPAFTAPDVAQLAAVAVALGVAADEIIMGSMVDVGVVWFTLQLCSAEKVIALEPNMALLAALGNVRHTGVCVFGLHEAGSPTAVEVRAFAPADGVPEDPVCGSGNGCVAAMIRRHGLLAGSGYVASQGRCLGRDGHVEVEFDADGTIWLGGKAVTCVDGSIVV
ncbi:MAG: PhzF family phenazine biosynthesis protein [Thermodesulfobacteriota bacterium]